MFCMCIDRGCGGTWERNLSSLFVLTEGALLQFRVNYFLYVYWQRVLSYLGEYVKFFMCIDRGCVGKGESKFCSLCVLTDGTLLQVRFRYVLYVYLQRVRCFMGK